MNQLINVNYNVPYTGGYCEKYVENSIGLSGVFPRAIDGWNSNMGNHANASLPQGVIVPVYFMLANVEAGHVALSLGDGRIASSTQGGYHTSPVIHSSLQNLIDVYSDSRYGNGKCTYLGWSEYIGRKQVVSIGGKLMDKSDSAELVRVALHRDPTDSDVNLRVGMKTDKAGLDIRQSQEWLAQNHKIAFFDKVASQVADLGKLVDQLNKNNNAKINTAALEKAIQESQEALQAVEELKKG